MSKLGKTGKFPNGKLVEADEGELVFQVGIKKGCVYVDFGTPVQWFSMPPERAQQLAKKLLDYAFTIEKRGPIH